MIPLALLLLAPALFPALHPLAVWVGLSSIAVAAVAFWKADEWGNSEGTLRADEASVWLAMMSDRRVA